MKNNKGVSPVIGVVILVAITVALASVAAFTIFNISGDNPELSKASVQTDVEDGKIGVDLIRNKNLDRIIVRDAEGNDILSRDVSGEVGSFTAVPGGGGIYSVIAQTESSSQIIQKYDVPGVNLNLSIGGQITSDATFNITHDGGQTINAENMSIWIDAEDACGKSTRFVKIPVDEGDPRPAGTFTEGDDILDNSYNSVSGTINNETDNLYEKGDQSGFSVAESECEMDAGDKLSVSIVDTINEPIIIGQGNYTVVP